MGRLSVYAGAQDPVENKRQAMEEMILERFPKDTKRLKDYGI